MHNEKAQAETQENSGLKNPCGLSNYPQEHLRKITSWRIHRDGKPTQSLVAAVGESEKEELSDTNLCSQKSFLGVGWNDGEGWTKWVPKNTKASDLHSSLPEAQLCFWSQVFLNHFPEALFPGSPEFCPLTKISVFKLTSSITEYMHLLVFFSTTVLPVIWTYCLD